MSAQTAVSLVILVLVAALAIGLMALTAGGDPFAILNELDVMNGAMPSAQDLSGRPTLVVTWNTWCPGCIQELLYLRENHEEIRARVNLVAINLTRGERSLGEVHEFLDEAGLPYVVLADPEGKAGERFASRYIPASFLLDTGGEIINRMEGPVTLKILDEWLGQR